MTGAVLADAPQRGLPGLVRDESDVRGVQGAADGRRQAGRVVAGLGSRVPACLHQQPGATGRQPDVVAGGMGQLQQLGRERLHRERPFGQQGRNGLRTDDVVAEPEHEQAAGGGRSHQADGGAGHDGAGALGADKRAGKVSPAFREQPVERVAGDASWPGRQLTADERLVLVEQSREGRGELTVGRRPRRDRRAVARDGPDSRGARATRPSG